MSPIESLCRAAKRRGYGAVIFEADEDGDGWIVSVGRQEHGADFGTLERSAWGRTGRSALANLLMMIEHGP